MRIFLLLSTDNIGGAEKRFVGLWQSLCESKQDVSVFLVGSPKLFTALSSHKDISSSLKKFRHLTIEHDLSGNFKKYKAAVITFVHEHTKQNDVLHFIGDHPLRYFNKRIQVYSITQSSFKNLNLSGIIGQLGGVFFSNIIDVLDPGIHSTITKIFFYKKKNILRTSNSFCDVNAFKPLPFHLKKNWFVFLGRFEFMKQVVELMDCLPNVYNEVKTFSKSDLHFYFLGYGTQEKQLRKLLKEERFKGLPISIKYTESPNNILSESKFFFSLQLNNNYPSRSLIEAMSSGNIPVVTDVGQTRWLAKPEFSYYVPERFSKNDLVKALVTILNEDEETLEKKTTLARKFVMEEHTIEKMKDYYIKIYQTVLNTCLVFK